MLKFTKRDVVTLMLALVIGGLGATSSMAAKGGNGGGNGGGGKPDGDLNGEFGVVPDGANPVIAYGRSREMGVMDEDGANQTVLMDGSTLNLYSSPKPSWSPDGTCLAFKALWDTGEKGLYVYDIYTGDLQLLYTPNSSVGKVRWSPTQAPDGKHKILFYDSFATSYGPTQRDIMVINADGSDNYVAKNITNTPLISESPMDWSPDSTTIVSYNTYNIINSEGNLETVGYSSVIYDVDYVDLDNPIVLSEPIEILPKTFFDESDGTTWNIPNVVIRWSNHGTMIAFDAARRDSNGDLQARIFALDVFAATENIIPLTLETPGRLERIAWSPDDMKLLTRGNGIPVEGGKGKNRTTGGLYRIDVVNPLPDGSNLNLIPITEGGNSYYYIDWWRGN